MAGPVAMNAVKVSAPVRSPAIPAPAAHPAAAHPAVQAAAHAAQRAQIAHNNPILSTGVLNPAQTLQAAQGLVAAEYGQPLAELASQIAQNNKNTAAQEKLVGGYFNQLGQYGQQAVGQEQNLAAGLNSQLAGIGDRNQQALGQIGTDAQASLMKYAPGGDVSLLANAPAQLAQNIALQRGIAANNDAAFQAQGAEQGANYGQLAAGNQQAYMKMGQQDLSQLANAGTLLNERPQAQIQADRQKSGNLLAADLYKIRQQNIADRNAGLALGIKQQGVANQAAYDAARIKATYYGISQQDARQAEKDAQSNLNNIRSNQNRITAVQMKINAAASKAGKSAVYTDTGIKALSTGQQDRYFGEINTIKNTLLKNAGKPLPKATGGFPAGAVLTINQIKQAIGASLSHPVPKGVLDAAAELAAGGMVSASTIRELNNLGIVVGNRLPRQGLSAQQVAGQQLGNYSPLAPQHHGGV